MSPRYTTARSHLYHETQSSLPRSLQIAAQSGHSYSPHRLLLDLSLPPELLEGNRDWLRAARRLGEHLLPDAVPGDPLTTLSSYDRLSTALTVAQVCDVSRVSRHYAARLAPLPSPEASRSSNLRLAQMTEFARLLASDPTAISGRSRALLREAGLSERDIILLVLIVALVSLQARVVAIASVLMNQPQRLVPGGPTPADAGREWLSTAGRWRADVSPSSAGDYLPSAAVLHQGYALRPLRPLLRLLSWNAPLLSALTGVGNGLQRASHGRDIAWDPALIACRIHGTSCSWRALLRGGAAPVPLVDALLAGGDALTRYAADHPLDGAWINALTMLARAPERLSPPLLAPLDAGTASAGQRFALLSYGAAASAFCRIKMGLGQVC